MKTSDRNALLAFPILVLIGAWSPWLAARMGHQISGIPVFALAVGLAFLIQWLVFIPAYLLQTEKFFDLTGSLTYISITLIALGLSPGADGRALLLAALVVIWAPDWGHFCSHGSRRLAKTTASMRSNLPSSVF